MQKNNQRKKGSITGYMSVWKHVILRGGTCKALASIFDIYKNLLYRSHAEVNNWANKSKPTCLD